MDATHKGKSVFNNMEELVFAVPTERLWKLISYRNEGLIKGNSEILKKIVQTGLFLRRDDLEEDPSYKQIITYAIITNKNSFYLFRRSSGQTEKRLHNKFSLGVGGHMNPQGSKELNEQYLTEELIRELNEEVRFGNRCLISDIEFIGFINDDSIPVGRVHIGLLYNILVSNKEVHINETDKMTAEWVDRTELSGYYEGMETWSRIILDNYIKLYNE